MKQKLSRKSLGTMSQGAARSCVMLGLAAVGITSTAVQSQSKLPQSVDPNAPELATAVVRSTGEEVPYDVINGMAVLEGDIILGTHAEVQAYGIDSLSIMGPASTSSCVDGFSCSVIDTSSNRRWPDGIIPYTVQAGTSAFDTGLVAGAIAEWENKTSIRFVERTNERDYVEFQSSDGFICSSRLGRSGGRQAITFAGASCLVHEIGHAVGLSHEQNRNDRDEHITIDFSNLSGNAASQFRKATTSTDVGPYDFASVMHYTAFLFALDRSRPVIRPLDPNIPLSAVGGTTVLSPTDVLGVEFVYGNGDDGTTSEPQADQQASVQFVGLNDGGTIPAFTRYGDVQVLANDPDAGTSDGDGIQSVALVVSRDGRELGGRTESFAPYDFGMRLIRGRTYTLTATAQSTEEAGGTASVSSVTVTAR